MTIQIEQFAKLASLLRQEARNAGIVLSELQFAKKLKNGWRFMKTRSSSYKLLEKFALSNASEFPELTQGQIVDSVSALVNTNIIDPIDGVNKLMIEIDPTSMSDELYLSLLNRLILS